MILLHIQRLRTQVFGVLDALRPIRAGAAVSYHVLSHRPAWEPAGSQALLSHVRSIAAELGEQLEAAVSPGGGDANFTGALGVPTVDGLGPRGHGAHAPDETVDLASIIARASLLVRLFTSPWPG